MSTVRLLVLGSILRRGASHGYGVYADITSWRADTWTNVKPGSIYHALEKLEKQGLIIAVQAANDVKLGPAKTEYAVTPSGAGHFETLLEAALVSSDIQQFAVGIAFMEMLAHSRAAALLQNRCDTLRQSASFLHSLPTDDLPGDPSRHPELVGLWASYVENQAVYTEKMRQRVLEGQYRFKGEE